MTITSCGDEIVVTITSCCDDIVATVTSSARWLAIGRHLFIGGGGGGVGAVEKWAYGLIHDEMGAVIDGLYDQRY